MLSCCRLPDGWATTLAVANFCCKVGGFTVIFFSAASLRNLATALIFRLLQGDKPAEACNRSRKPSLMESLPGGEKRAKATWQFGALGIVVCSVALVRARRLGSPETRAGAGFDINHFSGSRPSYGFAVIHDPPYISAVLAGVEYWGIGLLAMGNRQRLQICSINRPGSRCCLALHPYSGGILRIGFVFFCEFANLSLRIILWLQSGSSKIAIRTVVFL